MVVFEAWQFVAAEGLLEEFGADAQVVESGSVVLEGFVIGDEEGLELGVSDDLLDCAVDALLGKGLVHCQFLGGLVWRGQAVGRAKVFLGGRGGGAVRLLRPHLPDHHLLLLPHNLPTGLGAARHILASRPPLVPRKHVITPLRQSEHQLVIPRPDCKMQRGGPAVGGLELEMLETFFVCD